jgi:hypothetical protein
MNCHKCKADLTAPYAICRTYLLGGGNKVALPGHYSQEGDYEPDASSPIDWAQTGDDRCSNCNTVVG